MRNRILFINAAPREQSRTRQLADIVLNKLGGSVTEEKIYEYVFPQTTEFFLKSRDEAAAHGVGGRHDNRHHEALAVRERLRVLPERPAHAEKLPIR